MDSLEINKIVAGLLVVVLIIIGITNFAEILYHVEQPKVAHYVIEGVDDTDMAEATDEPVAAPVEDPFLLYWHQLILIRGVVDGFSYSSALVNHGGKWSYEELNGFLKNPKKYIEGTKMSFAGLKKATDRANVILYLRSLSDNPAPLE